MSKTAKKKPAFASLNPEDMIQGGLPSDFRGVVTEAVYVKWDYDGAIDGSALFARLTIQPGEGEEVNQGKPIVQHYSAGDLRAWAPADSDGDFADEGPYAARVGKKAEMSRTSNFAHLMETVLESGAAAKGKPFTAKQLGDGAITCLVGLDAHWDRVPQKVRSGMTDIPADDEVDEDDDEKEENKPRNNKRDILVVTEVFGYDPDNTEAPKATKKKAKAEEADDEDETEDEEEEEAPVVKKKKKPAVEEDDDEEAEAEAEAEDEDADEAEEDEEEESPLDAEISKAIAKELKAAGGTLKKGKLAALVLKAFAANKSKSKAVNRVAEEEFLSAKTRPWTFNEDTGVLKSKK